MNHTELHSNLDLSIIIVNWNTCQLLKQCLASIYTHTHGIAYEIVVVDNASSDDSVAMLNQAFPDVCLIANQQNVGFAAANNQAIRQATGRYIVLLNSDTALQDNALFAMLEFMDAHPEAGFAGTRLLNADGSHQPSCDCFPRTPFQLLRDKVLDRWRPRNTVTRRGRMAQWRMTDNFPVDYVIGAALLIRRAALEQIGALDEAFFMYAEDIDWCFRAALAGWATYYLGRIAIFHLNRGSSEATPELSARLRCMRETSLLKFYNKHYGLLSRYMLQLILWGKRL